MCVITTATPESLYDAIYSLIVTSHLLHLQIETDHRSLWWNDDQSPIFVPIPNTKKYLLNDSLENYAVTIAEASSLSILC